MRSELGRCFVSRPDSQAGEPARRWFITSDRGHIVDGRLQVLGRLDDVIISGGIKVEPGPIEALLALNPLVSECAVVGLPDLQWGQVVTAVVVPASMPGLGRVDEVLFWPKSVSIWSKSLVALNAPSRCC